MKVLKPYIFLFIAMILFISCKENKKKSSQNEVKKNISSKEVITKDRNIAIINGLREIKKVIENSDNKGLSNFFVFPSNRYYYVNPKQAIKIFKDSMITKEYFIKNSYVPNIDSDPSLDNLLGKLDLDLLKSNDVVEKSFEIENDECSYFYKIEVNDKKVKITYKSMPNPKYENDEYSCEPESDIIYMKMDGDRLLFDQDKIEMSYEPAAG
ncbi:hypothetical protein ACSTS3_15150 [Aquimarina muelleri]|uniref:hypothetical protein n=1 Tax=Aquimarina muelleri TaxID=279356 RepID=UPI003F68407A